MHTVTLKADNQLYQQISQMAEELHLSKSELIRKALAAYQENLSKNKMQHALQSSSLQVRDANTMINKELDEFIFDGLSDV
jgi:predicted transcriptional regulator